LVKALYIYRGRLGNWQGRGGLTTKSQKQDTVGQRGGRGGQTGFGRKPGFSTRGRGKPFVGFDARQKLGSKPQISDARQKIIQKTKHVDARVRIENKKAQTVDARDKIKNAQTRKVDARQLIQAKHAVQSGTQSEQTQVMVTGAGRVLGPSGAGVVETMGGHLMKTVTQSNPTVSYDIDVDVENIHDTFNEQYDDLGPSPGLTRTVSIYYNDNFCNFSFEFYFNR